MDYKIYQNGIYSEYFEFTEYCKSDKFVFYEKIIYSIENNVRKVRSYEPECLLDLNTFEDKNKELVNVLIENELKIGAYFSIIYKDVIQYEEEIHIRAVFDSQLKDKFSEIKSRSIYSRLQAGYGNRLCVQYEYLMGYLYKYNDFKYISLNIKYYLLTIGYSETQIKTSTTGYYYVKHREGIGEPIKMKDYLYYYSNKYKIYTKENKKQLINVQRYNYFQAGKGGLIRPILQEVAIDSDLKMGGWISVFEQRTDDENNLTEYELCVCDILRSNKYRKNHERKLNSDKKQLKIFYDKINKLLVLFRKELPKFEDKIDYQYLKLENGSLEFKDFINIICVFASISEDLILKDINISEITYFHDPSKPFSIYGLKKDQIREGLAYLIKFENDGVFDYRYFKIYKVESEPLDFNDEKYLMFPPNYINN